MFLIECPYCGARDEREFTGGGEAHLERPETSVDDHAWGEYLYFRDNPKGVHHERWCHSFGCGAWFNLTRDTVTHEILRVYPITWQRPESKQT